MDAVAAVSSARGRGRPRTFDEDAVLDALTALFTEQGYEATSVADIADAAGLNKSSLYNTFGSKEELFKRVLDRYVARRLDILAMAVEGSGSGIAGVHAFLDLAQRERATVLGKYGCLALNTSAELGGSSPEMAAWAASFRRGMEERIGALVAQAATDGEIQGEHVEHYSTLLVMFLVGLSMAVRSGASDTEIDRLFEAAHAAVDSWRR